MHTLRKKLKYQEKHILFPLILIIACRLMEHLQSNIPAWRRLSLADRLKLRLPEVRSITANSG